MLDDNRCDVPVCAATLISTGNAEAAIGQDWRWCRDFARRVGVPVLRVGKKSFIDAAALVAAIQGAAQGSGLALNADGVSPIGDSEPLYLDPAEAVRAALGKQRKDAA